MLQRHWTRLSELTSHSFQVDSDSFSLRNIMEAPLLKYKEDIEVLMLKTLKLLMLMWTGKQMLPQSVFLILLLSPLSQIKI